MSDEKLPLEAVTERDIDILLLEEVATSPDFMTWIGNQAGAIKDRPVTASGVWHSVSDSALGESDLLVCVEDPSRNKIAILIENKIDAPPQPEQARRYRERGTKGVESGDWVSFRTMIVAPERYLKGDAEASHYDAKLSYEQLRAWYLEHSPDSARMAFKAQLILQGILQNRRGYSPVMDEKVTRFFHEYWMLARKSFPELNTEDPGSRPSSSGWLSFKPAGLGKGQKIWHKIDYGQVDLELPFGAERVDALLADQAHRLPSGVSLVKRGKSAGLRIEVPVMDRFEPFQEQEASALISMKAALRLSALVNVLDGA